MKARKSRSSCAGGTGSRCSTAAPSALAGRSAAAWARPGSPSAVVETATIASSRSSARSVRSSRVSGSSPRWVWMQRRPRNRPRPARTRPQSGSSIERASPTITWVTAPPRSTSTPTWRRVSPVSSVSCRANSWVIRRSGGICRRKRRSSRRTWLAFSPWVLPKMRMVSPCRARWIRSGNLRNAAAATQPSRGPLGEARYLSQRPSSTLARRRRQLLRAGAPKRTIAWAQPRERSPPCCSPPARGRG